jgi:LytS/YehU family sensor histidine kinase
MKIRLPQTVDVQFRTQLANPDTRVAPLLFISLVENAFKHGISPTEPCFVHIDMEQPDDGHLFVTIKNSNYPKTENDRSGHGVGLQQVQRRLDLAYSERYEWTHGVSDDGKTYLSTLKIEL